MKLLLVIENLNKGGKQRRLIQLIKGLVNTPDIEFNLVVLSRKIEYQEIYTITDRIIILDRKWRKDPTLFLRFYRLCKQLHPDIIHTWGSMSSVYVLPAVILRRIRLVNSMIVHATKLRFSDEDRYRSLVTFPFSHCIIANSKAGLEAFRVNSKKGFVIYNGFDFERLKRIVPAKVIKQKFNLRTRYIVGMVAAFEDRKDYNLFVQSASEIVKLRDDVSFIAVGGGKNLVNIQSQVGNTFKEKIIFTGIQNDVESIINIFDIGVLLTCRQVHGEGISNSIMEYMALGKPVIATSGGGTNEIVSETETGILIDDGNKQALNKAINTLLNSNDMRQRMGMHGKEIIRKKFNLSDMTREYLNIYTNSLAK